MINLPWLELEGLARDIANLEDRLRAARSTRKHELAERLEQELEAAKARRPRLLDALARQGVASTTSPGSTEPDPAAICEWDRLTPADLDQAKHALACRRAATLARHAEELQALEAERQAIDALAIDALERDGADFARNFRFGSSRGTVIELDSRRPPRLQAAS